ncbi:kinase-like protein [Acephala macrosclerotiorum]|nr:kinase-like protein [Acephala macrosclerotiorum]
MALSSANSCSDPINSTRLNRFLVLAGVKLLRRFRPCWGSVLFLTPSLCVKIGKYTDLSEASTMQFIRKNTSIPVPKVYCAFRWRGKAYIAMERITGMPAAASWERLSEQSRTKLLGQLREMIDEMRKIPAANGKISNVDGGSLYDCRLPSSLDRFGPFENTQEFHTFLRNSIEKAPPEHPDVDEMISMHRREWGQPVFTHGDLSSLNILVRGGDIVGLVDWETAGWYPPYWEYTSACQVNPRNTFWAGYISRFLEPWPEALKMEKTRQQWWGVI